MKEFPKELGPVLTESETDYIYDGYDIPESIIYEVVIRILDHQDQYTQEQIAAACKTAEIYKAEISSK